MRVRSRAWLAAASSVCVVRTALADDPLARDVVERARDSVLARAEFRYSDPDEPKSSLVQFLIDAQQWLQRMQEQHPIAFWSVFALMALLALALLAHVIWTFRASGRRRRVAPELDLEAAMRHADPAPFRRRAVECAERGELDEAVRALYTALILRLDRLGHLRFARHKAVLDYRLEIADAPTARDTFEQFCSIYHPGSFGRRPPTRLQFDALLMAYDRMKA